MDLQQSEKYLNYIMDRFYPIGEDSNGGVTRLAYTALEDQMHEEFISIGKEEGYQISVDQVGNSYLSLGDYDEYYLVGSHLDSVVNGGRYDGVLGVAVGLLLLKVFKEEKIDIPLKVVALRCEESSNFMKATFGSSLITGEVNPKDFELLKSRTGENLGDIFDNRGYSKNPEKIKGVKNYIELHIEQGRILESEDLKVGIVTVIAGNVRLKVNIKGMAEHSGATPMNIRQDALCGAAQIILGVEKIGQGDFTSSAVATVGVIENYPNSVNVIPGEVELSIDIRDGDNSVIENIRLQVEDMIKFVCNKRGLSCNIKKISSSSAVSLDKELTRQLSNVAEELGIEHKIMPSGAGHDAMKFAKIAKSSMIFIPCKNGISHNPLEEAKLEDAALGAKIIYEYLKGELS